MGQGLPTCIIYYMFVDIAIPQCQNSYCLLLTAYRNPGNGLPEPAARLVSALVPWCLLEEVGKHFILTWCFSISHSVYEKVDFPESGDWVSQPFLFANRSVGGNTRLFQERSIPYSTLVGAEVLRVAAIALHMGAEMVCTPARASIFPIRGCGLLPGHRDRTCVPSSTCGKGVTCRGLEEGFCCCNEIVFKPWARR